jgi:predicted nucleic acid-binding protein
MFADGSGEVDVAQLILVDTDILIDAGRKGTEAVDYLEHMERHASLGVSVITQMELMVSCRNKRELRVLERFLRRFRIMTLNEAIAATGVTLLRQYQWKFRRHWCLQSGN